MYGSNLGGTRTYSSPALKYRYGFNGKENEGGDINGADGASYDLGARIYDARIGRFLSRDPRETDYPWQSTYVYFMNCPTSEIDINGEGGPGVQTRPSAARTASPAGQRFTGNTGKTYIRTAQGNNNGNNRGTAGGSQQVNTAPDPPVQQMTYLEQNFVGGVYFVEVPHAPSVTGLVPTFPGGGPGQLPYDKEAWGLACERANGWADRAYKYHYKQALADVAHKRALRTTGYNPHGVIFSYDYATWNPTPRWIGNPNQASSQEKAAAHQRVKNGSFDKRDLALAEAYLTDIGKSLPPGYSHIIADSKGGRWWTEPQTDAQVQGLQEVLRSFRNGTPIMGKGTNRTLDDPELNKRNITKYSYEKVINGENVIIHYLRDNSSGQVFDIKFKTNHY